MEYKLRARESSETENSSIKIIKAIEKGYKTLYEKKVLLNEIGDDEKHPFVVVLSEYAFNHILKLIRKSNNSGFKVLRVGKQNKYALVHASGRYIKLYNLKYN